LKWDAVRAVSPLGLPMKLRDLHPPPVIESSDAATSGFGLGHYYESSWPLLLWFTEGGVLLLAATLTDGTTFIALVVVSVVVALALYLWARRR
jgi:hypothetical protein